MTECENGQNPIPEAFIPVSTFRRALPQVLASTAKNLLLLDLGMTIAFSTIVIPVLLDGTDRKGLFFSKQDASWFGSIIYICQPLGSILSGLVLEPFGRKYSMMAVNVPHIVGWFIYYSATSKGLLFTAATIMGFGVGFMEAPILTYVGEICEPRFRGTLTLYANLFLTFGIALIFFLGTLFDWRTVAILSMTVPIITIIALIPVPETPLWLMARGRDKEAEKSLCWLRGWVSPEAVAEELAELKQYSISALQENKTEKSYDNPACDESTERNPSASKWQLAIISNGEAQISNHSNDGKSNNNANLPTVPPHDGNWINNIKTLGRPAVLKPLSLIVAFFFISNFTGIAATRPYMVLLCKEFEFPIDPYEATVVFGVIGFVGSLSCMLTVSWFKKRPIALVSVLMCFIITLLLALLPKGGWLPCICYGLLMFFSLYGAYGLVWSLVSEVFPLRGRSQASGVAGASSYVVAFIATKSFLSLTDHLGFQGVFFVYAASSGLGFIYLYFFMPETEGVTLEQIEKNYKKSIFYQKLSFE